MSGPKFLHDAERFRLPRPQAPGITATGFMLCAAQPASCQQLLYQLAFEQAQRVVQPSILERRLLDVWN